MITVIYLWRIAAKRAPQAIWHMASDRRKLKRDKSLGFFKLIGTGTGQTFTPRDADPTLWGLIVTIDADALLEFDSGPVVEGWRSFAKSELRYLATPISSHGQWSKQEPFEVDVELSKRWQGKILALTRARIQWQKNLQFWRAVPPVIESLRGCAGVESAIGFGEAPLGLQGTLSIWNSGTVLREFAYKDAAHSAVIRETKAQRWYSEELFARFALQEVRGAISRAK